MPLEWICDRSSRQHLAKIAEYIVIQHNIIVIKCITIIIVQIRKSFVICNNRRLSIRSLFTFVVSFFPQHRQTTNSLVDDKHLMIIILHSNPKPFTASDLLLVWPQNDANLHFQHTHTHRHKHYISICFDGKHKLVMSLYFIIRKLYITNTGSDNNNNNLPLV